MNFKVTLLKGFLYNYILWRTRVTARPLYLHNNHVFLIQYKDVMDRSQIVVFNKVK